MARKSRKNYNPEFRLETAQLVIDHGYSHEEAAKAMNVGYSTIGKWVKQLKEATALLMSNSLNNSN